MQEFLVGKDLRRLLDERRTLPPREALEIIVPAASALVAAHRVGVVHRDLKPENLFLSRSPSGQVVKLIDFGIARIAESAASGVGLTRTGAMLGTPLYMSPEQARGERNIDAGTDIWAMGVVLFEMLAGQRAFAGETSTDVIAKVLEREPAFNALPADVAPEIGRLLRRCLEKDPRRRLRDIGDARLELAESQLPARQLETSVAAPSPAPAAP